MEYRRRKKQNAYKKDKTTYGPFNPRAMNRLQTKETASLSDLGEDIRLNKYVAHCGICSRRKADEHIKQGLIKVNGKIINEPGHRISPKDEVQFRDEVIKPEVRRIYVLMNKPKGTITTSNDEKGRKTVMDLIGTDVKERIYPVGRLDKETTGLLVLTNDGDLAKKLSHPSYNVKKIYHVVLDKPVVKKDLQSIINGLKLEDGVAEVDGIDYVKNKGKEEVGIEVHIGKNRIVRRIFEHLGYEVIKLDRMYYGGLTKKDLPRGHWRNLTSQEVINLGMIK